MLIVFLLMGIVCFKAQIAFSQEYIELNGVVLDKETNLPLPFANIALKGTSIGTVSNKIGEFKFKVPSGLIDKNLVFSYLGYKVKLVPVKNCLGNYSSIKLPVLPFSLNTINIKFRSPEELIELALNKVSDNYLNYPVNLTSFYREEVKENNQQIQFIEAVIEVYKSATNNKKEKDRLEVVKGREQMDVQTSVFFKYLYFVDGPYEAISLDVSKYPTSFLKILHNSKNFLNPKHFEHYSYDFQEIMYDTAFNNRYIITFKPKTKKALLQGKIILDKESLAFLSLEFWLDETGIANAQLINYKNERYLNDEGFRTKALNYHCLANFRSYKNKYIINNSRINYSFNFIDKSEKDTLKISNSIDFIVTKVNEQKVKKIKWNKSVWRGVSLSKQLGAPDPAFWGNYNTIKSLDNE